MGNTFSDPEDSAPPGVEAQPILSWDEAVQRAGDPTGRYTTIAGKVTTVQNPFNYNPTSTILHQDTIDFKYSSVEDCNGNLYQHKCYISLSDSITIPEEDSQNWVFVCKFDCPTSKSQSCSVKLNTQSQTRTTNVFCFVIGPKSGNAVWRQWYYIQFDQRGILNKWEMKMRCNGNTFTVQKIYSQGDDEETNGLCLICQDAQAVTMVMPCRHLCLCEICARQIGTKCPVCRGPCTSFLLVDKSTSHSIKSLNTTGE